MFEFEKPVIEDEIEAIEAASLYASSIGGQILMDVSEIPYKYPGLEGEDPTNYQEVVKPPFAVVENNTYSVELYTWNNGALINWDIEIITNLDAKIQREILSTTVGDHDHLE
jgi:hypothetical protein